MTALSRLLKAAEERPWAQEQDEYGDIPLVLDGLDGILAVLAVNNFEALVEIARQAEGSYCECETDGDCYHQLAQQLLAQIEFDAASLGGAE